MSDLQHGLVSDTHWQVSDLQQGLVSDTHWQVSDLQQGLVSDTHWQVSDLQQGLVSVVLTNLLSPSMHTLLLYYSYLHYGELL